MLTELRGRRATISIHYGTDAAPADAPLIVTSEVGFSPLVASIGRGPGDEQVKRLAGRMQNAANGLWLALCDVPDSSRRVALVRSARGSGAAPNFYQKTPTRRGEVWRDYYYAAAYVLFREIDRCWPGTTEVVL